MNPCRSPSATNCAMTPSTVQTSTFYPPIRMRDMQDASLQPLCIGICFSGALPRHLVRGVIPIQISVSIAEEYRSFTTPVLEALSMDGYPHSGCSGNTLSCDNIDIPIPFLPLPHNFDPTDSYHWSQLSEQIQLWLVTIPEDSQYWTWGRDAFWLAFVGACPDFPNGRWPKWDARIPLEGQFIEHWLEGGAIWSDFCNHAMLFHPEPLVSIDVA
ncbi:hypothetical protein EV424DRAFT_1471406 [Suillus variegatus]|nr:hypothetical protein EV424DRAFT_1471406 [Suillus variegatus]